MESVYSVVYSLFSGAASFFSIVESFFSIVESFFSIVESLYSDLVVESLPTQMCKSINIDSFYTYETMVVDSLFEHSFWLFKYSF